MILARAPLRLSFGGGGTDLPAYYEPFGGYVVSSALTAACRNSDSLSGMVFIGIVNAPSI